MNPSELLELQKKVLKLEKELVFVRDTVREMSEVISKTIDIFDRELNALEDDEKFRL